MKNKQPGLFPETPDQIAADMRASGEVLHRASDIAESYDGDTRTLSLAFASETPVERWYGKEILSCSPEDVDMSRLRNKAPLLMHHDPTFQIGVVTEASVDADKVARAKTRLSKRRAVESIAEDIADGIVSKVSVGYELLDAIDDVRGVNDEGEPTGERTIRWRWRPVEISLVSVPADDRVGVGRSRGGQEQEPEAPAPQTEERAMKENEKETPPVADGATVETARSEERTRVSEIIKLGRKHEMGDLAAHAIEAGTDLSTFREQVMDEREKRQADPPEQDTSIGMSGREVKRFSWLRAIRSTIPGESVDATFERECSDAVALKLGRDPKGIFIPAEVTGQTRTQLGVGGSFGTGGQLVATELLSDQFIDILRNRIAVVGAGATMLTGLEGNIAIPKQSSASTAYWVNENVAPTTSRLALTQVTGTPRTVGAYTDLTRKLLLQSSLDVEVMVRTDLAAVLAREIDRVALHGTGSAPQPTGIENTASVTEVTIGSSGSPTYAEILAFVGAIKADNADIGDMKWIMPAGVWETLAGTLVTATYGERHILDAQGPAKLIGFDYTMSNQVEAGKLFLGVWSQLVIGMWGALDLTSDPYSLSTTGAVRVVALQDVDVMVRHPEAFSFGTGVASGTS